MNEYRLLSAKEKESYKKLFLQNLKDYVYQIDRRNFTKFLKS